MTNPRPNPYPGPRPFKRGEKLYGRQRETAELLDLLIAERIVLLSSPSGAGKTSLVQAALIPELEREGFRVLPVLRPGLLSSDAPPSSANRYVLSLLLGLEQARPAAEQLSLAGLAGETLVGYLDRMYPAAGGDWHGDVLIFDQFEEVLTVDPTDRETKLVFFEEVGRALRNRDRWALFSMREEYVAALDPYLRPIPARFDKGRRYRLDLLGREAGVAAMQGPAADQDPPVVFTGEAAGRLADDLRRAQVQQPDGSMVASLGQHIEPVQLQVVCRRLWDSRAAGDLTIDTDDLAAVGDVDTALRSYYADTVARVAGETGIRERVIREWCGRQLITEAGIRGQVLKGYERSPEGPDGLPNAAIGRLDDAHLARSDQRRGATWFELAHDRLIAPVRADNAAWFAANLSNLQRQAAEWERQGRAENLLLRDRALAEAEAWAAGHGDEVEQSERDFLQRSRAAEDLAAELGASQRRRRALIAISIFLPVMLALSGWALVSRTQAVNSESRAVAETTRAVQAEATAEAERVIAQDSAATAQVAESDARHAKATAEAESLVAQDKAAEAKVAEGKAKQSEAQAVAARSEVESLNRSARANELTTRALTVAGENRELALLLAVEGLRVQYDITRTSFITQTAFDFGRSTYVTTTQSISAGEPVAGAALTNMRRLLDAASAQLLPIYQQAVVAVAFSPDGRWLATGSRDSSVRLWDLVAAPSGAISITNPITVPNAGSNAAVSAITFGPGVVRSLLQNWIAATYWNGAIQFTDISGDSPTVRWRQWGDPDTSAFLWAVAASPDARWLAGASTDGSVDVWNLTADAPANTRRSLRGHTDWVRALVFTADGRRLVSASADGTARLWFVAQPGREPLVFAGHASSVWSAAISPDDTWLATGSEDRTVRLWSLLDLDRPATVLAGHDAAVVAVAFAPDGRWLASASGDRTVRLWSMSDHGRTVVVLKGHTARIGALAFSPDGRWLATAADDNTVRIWSADFPGLSPAILDRHTGPVVAVAFSPDGHWLATGSEDHSARLWRWQTPDLLAMACQRVTRNLSLDEWQSYFPERRYRRTCTGLPASESVLTALLKEGRRLALGGNRAAAEASYREARDLGAQIGDPASEVDKVLAQGAPTLAAHKLGFYIENTDDPRLLEAIQRVKPRVIFVHPLDHGFLRTIRRLSPDSFVVGRFAVPFSDQQAWLASSDPAQAGRDYARRISEYNFGLAQARLNGRLLVDAWVGLNEALPGTAVTAYMGNTLEWEQKYAAYDQFHSAFLDELRKQGLEGVVLNFGAGNWTSGEDIMRYFPLTLAAAKYLGFHEYGWPTLEPAPSTSTGAGLYRRVMYEIRQKYGNQHIAIITEAGLARMYRYPADPAGDVGWLYPADPVSEAQYTKSLEWYNNVMMEDDFVLGAALFQVGPAGVWQTFRHLGTDNEGRPLRIMDWLAQLGD